MKWNLCERCQVKCKFLLLIRSKWLILISRNDYFNDFKSYYKNNQGKGKQLRNSMIDTANILF